MKQIMMPALAIGLLVSSFRPGDDTDTYRVNTIRQVMKRIAAEHYQPKVVNDGFSALIWKRFLEAQDSQKKLLLQEDITRLRAWEYQIDDELNTPSLGFFREANTILTRRIQAAIPLFRELLAKPMDLTRNDVLDEKNAVYPANAKEQRKAWERFLKLHVLQNIVGLQKVDASLSFASAEKEARKKVLDWLNTAYSNQLGETADEQRFAFFLNTVVMEIDPHTLYYAPADGRERDARMAHRFFGVGLELLLQEGEIRVGKILPGGAADQSGLLQTNDHILAVSNPKGEMVRVSGLSVLDVSRMVRGDSGTVLKMLVNRNGREVTVSLTRSEIKDASNAVKSAFIEKAGKTYGYIRLPEFYKDLSRIDGAQCAADVAKAVMLLKQDKIAGIIIDLRGNGGGSLEEVQKMAGLFLPLGPVTQGRFKDKIKRFDMIAANDVLYDGPLTIMIDEASASASEMFAGAMQDYGRAVIVGSASSFGKGTMQETRQMGKLGNKTLGTPNISYGSLNLTLGKFYRVTGASTQLNGVKPDVVFPGKGEWNILREKNYPTAFEPDSMEAAYFEKSKHAARLPDAIAAARLRAQKDTGFTNIRQSVDWLMAHAKDPKQLKYGAFRKVSAEQAGYEYRLDAATRLPETALLQVRATEAGQLHPSEESRRQEWLKGLKADRYISHAADLVSDLAR